MAKKSGAILGVLVGPSGSGKTELQKLLAAAGIGRRHITCTTRPPRPNETHGVDYYFLTQQEFNAKKQEGFFLEWASVHGNLYGTPKDAVLEALRAGETVILAIDMQGLRQIRQIQDPLIVRTLNSFFVYAGIDTIRQRISMRGVLAKKPVSAEELERRLATAREELDCRHECDKEINNDRDGEGHLKVAYENLLAALRSRQQCVAHESWRHWLRPSWQPRNPAVLQASEVLSATAQAPAGA